MERRSKFSEINQKISAGVTPLYEKDHLLSIEEVAKLLGKKPQTIRNYVAKRQIPFVPTCPVTFLERSIWAWLKKQEVQTWR